MSRPQRAPAPVDVVIPSVREAGVRRVLAGLRAAWREPLREVIVAWDAPGDPPALDGVRVVRSGGAGPAAARNAGWRASDAAWIAFLDDDVDPPPDWGERLRADIAAAGPDVAGVSARIDVPLPDDRPPTDWERNVRRLADARFVTADFACRRTALEDVGGFDPRFPRAYREDTDLELRLQAAGWRIERGGRRMVHPVGAATATVSARMQRGNADDVLLWALHGRRAGVPVRHKLRYLAVTAAGTGAVVAALTGRRRATALAAGAWLAETTRFAWVRIAPGPRTAAEVGRMALTSAAIPPAAVVHLVGGLVRHRALLAARLRRRLAGRA